MTEKIEQSLKEAKNRQIFLASVVKTQLSMIMNLVDSQLNVNEPNWGHVGSTAHICEQLDEILESFGHERMYEKE